MYNAPWQSGKESVSDDESIEVMGFPGVIDDDPITALTSDGLSSRELSRSSDIGFGGGFGLGRVTSQMPTPPTTRTSTMATAATMGHGLRVRAAGPWFQGV
ncbi:hypothetical protein LRC484719_53790 [Mycobacterium riyadhense]